MIKGIKLALISIILVSLIANIGLSNEYVADGGFESANANTDAPYWNNTNFAGSPPSYDNTAPITGSWSAQEAYSNTNGWNIHNQFIEITPEMRGLNFSFSAKIRTAGGANGNYLAEVILVQVDNTTLAPIYPALVNFSTTAESSNGDNLTTFYMPSNTEFLRIIIGKNNINSHFDDISLVNLTAPAPAEPSYEWLNVSWINPDFLNITEYGVNFSLFTSSSEAYINCSLNVSSADATAGTGVHGNLSAIVNDSVYSWWLTMENGTYAINMSCYAGAFYNSTDNFELNMLVPNITEPEVPAVNYTGTTYSICLTNATLYSEVVYTLDGASHNRSETTTCLYGCEANACNAAPLAQGLEMFKWLLALLVGITLIVIIGKYIS